MRPRLLALVEATLMRVGRFTARPVEGLYILLGYRPTCPRCERRARRGSRIGATAGDESVYRCGCGRAFTWSGADIDR